VVNQEKRKEIILEANSNEEMEAWMVKFKEEVRVRPTDVTEKEVAASVVVGGCVGGGGWWGR